MACKLQGVAFLRSFICFQELFDILNMSETVSLIVGTHVKAGVLSLLWKGFECNGEYCFMASGIK